MTNRRRSERIPVSLPVWLKDAHGGERTATADISAHGIAVLAEKERPLRQYIELEISLPAPRPRISVTAMVARHAEFMHRETGERHPGLGLDFFLFDSTAKAAWHSFLHLVRTEGLVMGAPPAPQPPVEDLAPPEAPTVAKVPERGRADQGRSERGASMPAGGRDAVVPERGRADQGRSERGASMPAGGRDAVVPERGRVEQGRSERGASMPAGGRDAVVPESAPEPKPAPRAEDDTPTFIIKPRDLGRLWAFYRGEMARGRVRIETPVLKPVGSVAELLVVHPTSQAEWSLEGRVAIANAHARGGRPVLEIELVDLEGELKGAFRNFVATGRGMIEEEINLTTEFQSDVSPAAANPRTWSPPSRGGFAELDLRATELVVEGPSQGGGFGPPRPLGFEPGREPGVPTPEPPRLPSEPPRARFDSSKGERLESVVIDLDNLDALDSDMTSGLIEPLQRFGSEPSGLQELGLRFGAEPSHASGLIPAMRVASDLVEVEQEEDPTLTPYEAPSPLSISPSAQVFASFFAEAAAADDAQPSLRPLTVAPVPQAPSLTVRAPSHTGRTGLIQEPELPDMTGLEGLIVRRDAAGARAPATKEVAWSAVRAQAVIPDADTARERRALRLTESQPELQAPSRAGKSTVEQRPPPLSPDEAAVFSIPPAILGGSAAPKPPPLPPRAAPKPPPLPEEAPSSRQRPPTPSWVVKGPPSPPGAVPSGANVSAGADGFAKGPGGGRPGPSDGGPRSGGGRPGPSDGDPRSGGGRPAGGPSDGFTGGARRNIEVVRGAPASDMARPQPERGRAEQGRSEAGAGGQDAMVLQRGRVEQGRSEGGAGRDAMVVERGRAEQGRSDRGANVPAGGRDGMVVERGRAEQGRSDRGANVPAGGRDGMVLEVLDEDPPPVRARAVDPREPVRVEPGAQQNPPVPGTMYEFSGEESQEEMPVKMSPSAPGGATRGRPPPPPPLSPAARRAAMRNPVENQRVAHVNVSSQGNDPDLDRDIALARARVVRSPHSVTACYRLSSLLVRRGEREGMDEALDSLKKVTTLEPNHPGAHHKLAEVLARRGEYGLAAEHLGRARRLGYRIDPDLEKVVVEGAKG